MPSEKRSSPLIDLAAVAVSPTLIMLMVGSLVFFLIEVLYAGNYSGRLLWCMGFFVIGTVLIARLSIQFSRQYAAIYSLGLGGACFLAMMTYVNYPPGLMRSLGPILNLLLMGLVWWLADRLTWDCTHLDEDRKTSGRGLLEAAGIDETLTEQSEAAKETIEPSEDHASPPREGLVGWVERFQTQQQALRKTSHTPGLWILYFTLAALPLFAVGQSMIDPEDHDRRRAAFLDMMVFVGSGLGLLVTTTLMGLRRYLEQRQASIPQPLVAGWLILGGVLILGFLMVGALLPRPHSETPWFGLSRPGSYDNQSSSRSKEQRDASRYDVMRDKNAGKGEGSSGSKQIQGKGKSTQQGKNKDGPQGQSQKKGQSSQGKSKSDQTKESSQNKQSGESKDNQQAKQRDNKSQEEQKQKDESSDPKSKSDENETSENQDEKKEEDEQNESSNETSDSTRNENWKNPLDHLPEVSSWISTIVRYVVIIAIILGALYFLLRYLSSFTLWAKNLLEWFKNLFKRSDHGVDNEATEETSVPRPRQMTFQDFNDPFKDGSANKRSTLELVVYTFEALDAWAGDHNSARKHAETPREFVIRLGHKFAALDELTFRLAELYVQAVYSKGKLPADTRTTLKNLWDQLNRLAR